VCKTDAWSIAGLAGWLAGWPCIARCWHGHPHNPLNNSISDDRRARGRSICQGTGDIDAWRRRLLAAFNNFNSSFYETRRSRVGIAAPVASLTAAAAAADYEAGMALSGLTQYRTDVTSCFLQGRTLPMRYRRASV